MDRDSLRLHTWKLEGGRSDGRSRAGSAGHLESNLFFIFGHGTMKKNRFLTIKNQL